MPYSVRVGSKHFGEDSSQGLLGSNAMLPCGRIPTFWRTLLPPSEGWSEWCWEWGTDIGQGV